MGRRTLDLWEHESTIRAMYSKDNFTAPEIAKEMAGILNRRVKAKEIVYILKSLGIYKSQPKPDVVSQIIDPAANALECGS